jgi:hypothetical protein
MTVQIADRAGTTFLHRLIGHPRPHWVTLIIALALVWIPICAAFLDGILGDLFGGGHWRSIYVAPAVILYILIVGPILSRTELRAIEAFRPVVQIDDEAFEQLIIQSSRANPTVEAAAFLMGAGLGLLLALTGVEREGIAWLWIWLTISSTLMFGLLGWAIYTALASTRLMAALHRQPLQIDIFDTKPFEPIGKQSLAISLVFVGGILLSMLFGIGQFDILAWQNWVIYAVLALVIVLVFFLNMRGTHRVLAAAKEKELAAVQTNILNSSRTLMERITAGKSGSSLGAEINALATYERRVAGTRTWPYDTTMLRTLFFSLVIPAAVELVKLVFNSQFR